VDEKDVMKEYNFVIDIGNTNIVFGIYYRNEQKHIWRCESAKTEDHEYYFDKISAETQTIGFDLNNIKLIAVSTVIPLLRETFQKLIKTKFKCPAIFVDAYTKLGLSFPIIDPGFIGSDLIVNAYAALKKYQTNCVVCDLGTATTIQLIGTDGFFFGTAIMPGVHTAANSLFQNASQLFSVEFSTPSELLGTSTTSSVLSGIMNGNLFQLEGFIRAIKKEYKHLSQIKTISTGGLAGLICQDSSEIDVIDPNLTLDGLNLICKELTVDV
jgi:type III pantothenate kinase